MSQSLADQLATTMLYGGNAIFIEDLYAQFLQDPLSVDPEWRAYFESLPQAGTGAAPPAPSAERTAPPRPQGAAPGRQATPTEEAAAKQGALSRLIQVYAHRGHLVAQLDPLELQPPAKPY